MFQENNIETCILSRVKQTTSPGWMHEASAQAWCTGKTQKDWVEREVEGGSGWGTHVNPWLIHFNVWQNSLQYCKLIRLQLIKKIKIKKNVIFYYLVTAYNGEESKNGWYGYVQVFFFSFIFIYLFIYFINDDGSFISISVWVEFFILLIQELVLLKFTLKSQCIWQQT